MLERLIGAQILRINETSIEVKLGDKVHTFEIVSDSGDCCGYADFTTNMLYSEEDCRNPIITNVELKNEEGDYDGESSVITFYGEHKALATIESEAGSGSGWAYGSYVTLRCKALDIEEDLASW